VTAALGDEDAQRRLREALGDPPGVVVAAFVETACEVCETMSRAVAAFDGYRGVSTRIVAVDDRTEPGQLGLDEVPTLVVLEGGLQRLRRVGHHEEQALESSVRRALDDLPPAYQHRSP
jgi:hypothetical protein